MTLNLLNIRRHVFVLLLIGIVFATQSYGQVDEQKLKSLKETYPWGSIYLTYNSLLNLESILNDQKKIIEIHQQHKETTVSRLQSFINQEKAQKKMNESVAFVEIDLNRVEAGFKKITDSGGEIRPIAWSKEAVVEIAYLCDRELNAIKIAQNIKRQIEEGNMSITSMWEVMTKIQTDPYLSAEVAFVLATHFRIQLTKKAPELTELKGHNTALFGSIDNFKTKFDYSFMHFQKQLWSKDFEMAKEDREFMERVTTFENSLKEAKAVPKQP